LLEINKAKSQRDHAGAHELHGTESGGGLILREAVERLHIGYDLLCQCAKMRSGDQETGMGERTGEGQSGRVNIGGSVGSVGGDIVGRDKITGAPSAAALDSALRPLREAIGAAPAEVRTEANAKLTALKQEAAKGKDANDSVIAKLVDGLIELVPAAASAVVSAFATPILGGIAGPVTGFVLDKIRST